MELHVNVFVKLWQQIILLYIKEQILLMFLHLNVMEKLAIVWRKEKNKGAKNAPLFFCH
jgi:hypothetical protein